MSTEASPAVSPALVARALEVMRAFVARTEDPDPVQDPELAALPRDQRLAESAIALPYTWVVALLSAQSQALGLAEWLEEAARRGDPARVATLRADLVAALTGGAS